MYMYIYIYIVFFFILFTCSVYVHADKYTHPSTQIACSSGEWDPSAFPPSRAHTDALHRQA